ncbi:hypothetical protein SDC9_185281 [bioreactor metagenome]|uniref:Uncharacterized protein n=1 Tax=bioreactor metagenome TaxID=1076179 RepID=A0A645HGA8_9ZZZZ
MFRVLALHLLLHQRPVAAPESGQVGGDLNRAMRRGEQFDPQRNPFPPHRRVKPDTVELLRLG